MINNDPLEYYNTEEEFAIDPANEENNCPFPKITVITGEENEEVIFKSKCKLYRFRDNEYKERGTGFLKLLRHKDTKKIRFILRQEKTLKIVANFFVNDIPLCHLKIFPDNDKKFKFLAYDCSEQDPKIEKFIIKFTDGEKAIKFRENFRKAQIFNKLLKENKDSELVYEPAINEDEVEDNELFYESD